MKKYFLLLAALPAVILFSCHRSGDMLPEKGGTVYLDLPETPYNYGKFFGGSNAIDNQATLGRVLFYDRHLSINNSVSCGTCHKQALAFSDNVPFSSGFENRKTGRNTPPIQNLGFSGFGQGGGFRGGGSLFWDGRENNIEKLIARPISNHVEMGIDDLTSLEAKLKALPYYKDLFYKAYGTEEITITRISNAVATFVSAISSTSTRFDQEQQGSGSHMNALELEGQSLFMNKYDCSGCHNEQIGGYFSGRFMNIGLETPYVDKGLGTISGNVSDNGKFKVPNLRNATLTAPYMHDGRFKTLDEVLEHYSHGIKADANLDTLLKVAGTGAPLRMNISAHEKVAIIAFLGTLADVNMITDPAYSDPFKIK
jgi:cytochrome c peroxidase